MKHIENSGYKRRHEKRDMKMDKGQKRARKRVIICIVFISIAVACLGYSAYIIIQSRSGGAVDSYMVDITKILVYISIFLLIISLGFGIPSLFVKKKVLDENYMKQELNKYVPDGECLVAGIYAIVNESKITNVFKNCFIEDGTIIPAQNNRLVSFVKGKFATYNAYIGITQTKLIVLETEHNKHYYESNALLAMPDSDVTVHEIESVLDWNDIGITFSLSDIIGCKTQKGSMGGIKCDITLKNDTYFKFLLPESAGPNANMPNHLSDRDRIIHIFKRA